jgi:hypothetical protein
MNATKLEFFIGKVKKDWAAGGFEFSSLNPL